MKKLRIKRVLLLLMTFAVILSITSCAGKTGGSSKASSAKSGANDDDMFGDVFGEEEFDESSGEDIDNSDASSVSATGSGAGSSKKNSSAKNSSTSTNVPADSKFTPLADDKKLGYNSNNLVGVDQFGRAFSTISSTNSGKAAGLFYFLTVGDVGTGPNYDVDKIIAAGNVDKMFKQESPEYPSMHKYYWGEPLWGYYKSEDEYVIRRHLELLTMAGIDYIAFDVTNAITYRHIYLPVLEIIEELVNEGWNPPRAVFYTHTKSIATVGALYADLYGRGLHKKAWYMVNGKPLIIGYKAPVSASVDDPSYGNTTGSAHPKEIADFFTWKNPIWPGSGTAPSDTIPWCDFSKSASGVPQQSVYGDYMNVQVASHPGLPLSLSVSDPTKYHNNWGRGYSYSKLQNVAADANKGTFFQSQWDRAISTSAVKNIFITGWNEWGAVKNPWGDPVSKFMMVDSANKEFSRDADLMKGGYQDAFYQQLISNMRKFKATSGKQEGTSKTIQMASGTSQWSSVKNVYRSVGAANYGRDYEGGAGNLYYKQNAPRNNIQEVRVANDKNNLYFYVKCENNITAYDKKTNWMNLFIGTGTPSQKGWEGYEYAVNRSPDTAKGTTTVHKLKSDFTGTSSGSATYRVDGSVMQITVPRSSVGMASASSVYFKVADQVSNPSDIMDYYVTGKSLPLGRLSHAYNIK